MKVVEIANKVLSHTVDAYSIAIFRPKNVAQEEIIFIAVSLLLGVTNIYILLTSCCGSSKKKKKGKED
jgi:hypothetical protein